MVETRSGRRTDAGGRGSFATGSFAIVSVAVAAIALSGAYVAFEPVEHYAHSLYERSHYSFGGGGAGRSYWDSVPSWEDVKDYASDRTNQVLPQPSYWEQAKALVTGKPVRQVQAEAAYATGQQKASDTADTVKQTAEEGYDRANQAYAQAKTVPDKVRQLLFGIKSKAVREAERADRLALEAQWRAEAASKEGWLEKLKHVVIGPSKRPSSQHYDQAKDAASAAARHTKNAASEAYQAAQAAATGAVSGGRGVARSAQGAAAAAGDIGSRSADSARDAAGTAQEYARAGVDQAAAAKDKAAEYSQGAVDAARAAQQAAAQRAQAAADATRSGSGHAGSAAEQAAHRTSEAAQRATHSAQEAAQQAKHRAQEAVH